MNVELRGTECIGKRRVRRGQMPQPGRHRRGEEHVCTEAGREVTWRVKGTGSWNPEAFNLEPMEQARLRQRSLREETFARIKANDLGWIVSTQDGGILGDKMSSTLDPTETSGEGTQSPTQNWSVLNLHNLSTGLYVIDHFSPSGNTSLNWFLWHHNSLTFLRHH